MQSIHHVVMTTFKRSINPRSPPVSLVRRFHSSRTHPARRGHPVLKPPHLGVNCIAIAASGELVGSQTPGELYVELADSRVLVCVTRNSFKRGRG